MSTLTELFIWECPGCGIRVQTLFDLHVNQRPICVECNIEMARNDCSHTFVQLSGEPDIYCSKCGSRRPAPGSNVQWSVL